MCKDYVAEHALASKISMLTLEIKQQQKDFIALSEICAQMDVRYDDVTRRYKETTQTLNEMTSYARTLEDSCEDLETENAVVKKDKEMLVQILCNFQK